MHDAVCRQSVGVAEGLGVTLGRRDGDGSAVSGADVVESRCLKGAESIDEEVVRQKFKHYDRDGSGRLETRELIVLAADLFQSFNPEGRLSAAQLKDMRENLLQQMDEKAGDKDGKVSFEEFLPWYREAAERHSRIARGAAQDQSMDGAEGSSALAQSRSSPSDSPLFIEFVRPGSVADEYGAQEGDELVEVAGKKVEGLSVEEVEGLLMGQAGTGVKVKGKRGESGEEYSAELVRRGEVGE
eukprot:405625-Rhodomonas_salina.1